MAVEQPDDRGAWTVLQPSIPTQDPARSSHLYAPRCQPGLSMSPRPDTSEPHVASLPLHRLGRQTRRASQGRFAIVRWLPRAQSHRRACVSSASSDRTGHSAQEAVETRREILGGVGERCGARISAAVAYLGQGRPRDGAAGKIKLGLVLEPAQVGLLDRPSLDAAFGRPCAGSTQMRQRARTGRSRRGSRATLALHGLSNVPEPHRHVVAEHQQVEAKSRVRLPTSSISSRRGLDEGPRALAHRDRHPSRRRQTPTGRSTDLDALGVVSRAPGRRPDPRDVAVVVGAQDVHEVVQAALELVDEVRGVGAPR